MNIDVHINEFHFTICLRILRTHQAIPLKLTKIIQDLNLEFVNFFVSERCKALLPPGLAAQMMLRRSGFRGFQIGLKRYKGMEI